MVLNYAGKFKNWDEIGYIHLHIYVIIFTKNPLCVCLGDENMNK